MLVLRVAPLGNHALESERHPVLPPGGLALFISQSGETADTLAALRHCKAAGQTIAVVVNVPTSSMAREADLLLPTHAGPEIGVASTKAFLSQIVACYLVGQAGLGIQELQALVDAKDERDAGQGIERQRAVFATLILVERRASRPAEQPALLVPVTRTMPPSSRLSPCPRSDDGCMIASSVLGGLASTREVHWPREDLPRAHSSRRTLLPRPERLAGWLRSGREQVSRLCWA